MKLHFESNLDYQHTAIESVCDLFQGQEICRTEFTVTRDLSASQKQMAFAASDLGIGIRLTLLDDELLKRLIGSASKKVTVFEVGEELEKKDPKLLDIGADEHKHDADAKHDHKHGVFKSMQVNSKS